MNTYQEQVALNNMLSEANGEITSLKAQLAAKDAACAEMRERINCAAVIIEREADNCENCHGAGRDHDGEGWLDATCPKCQWVYDCLATLHKATLTTCGQGWHSPQEWDALQAKCAEMRQFIQEIDHEANSYTISLAVKAFLESNGCGSDFVPRAEADKLREASKVLVEALKFYAAPASYQPQCGEGLTPIIIDSGDTAELALDRAKEAGL